MSSGLSLGPFIGLGVDLVFFMIFYKWYKNVNRNADAIKAAPYRKLDEKLIKELSQSSTPYLAYACVEGEVLPINQALTSHHNHSKHGVIQQLSITEHRSKRTNGIWSDVKNTIQETVQSVPFVLRRWFCKESDTKIVVNDPTTAWFVLDSLTVTHDSFEPAERGPLLSRGLDRIFGEIPKGVHHNERMLLTNTLLLGIGEVALSDGKLQLRPPRDGQMYILTTMSRSEVINTLSKKSFWIKVLVITTGVIGASILARILYKQVKQWQQARSREQRIREIRELRQQAADSASNTSYGYSTDENSCVVCLTNPREIVLLDCGHICLCAECVLDLPEPLTCPVCRDRVVRHIPFYNP